MKLSLAEVTKIATSEQAAYDFMESLLWPNGPVCPHCGVVNHAYLLKNQKTRTGNVSERKLWKCADCRKQFTVTVGSVMEGSKIPLSKWVLGFNLFCAGKNGVSSIELERQLDITHEAAWFMSQRMRYAMEYTGPRRKLTGVVESDETYIGGRRKGEYRGDHSVFDNKTPVVTLVERDGEARSLAVQKVTADTLAMNLVMSANQEVHLMTDENKMYSLAGTMFQSHHTVNHSQEEYARGANHVNTAEGFFSQLKRSIDGTHHFVSRRHLSRYLAEFDYRYNTRKLNDGERMKRTIRQTKGKRLMYDKVVKG